MKLSLENKILLSIILNNDPKMALKSYGLSFILVKIVAKKN